MAHPNARSYAYQMPQTPENMPSAYYYEDTEGYGGDYSESDDGSHQQIAVPPNSKELTELYRRKPVMQQTKETPYQGVYLNPE